MSTLYEEFEGIFDGLTRDVKARTPLVNEKQEALGILSVLLGCQGVEEYETVLEKVLHKSLSAAEVREVLFQAAAYLGLGRIRPFFKVTQKVFEKTGVQQLPEAGTTTAENRREKGTQVQVDIFGSQMEDFWKQSDINYLLASNCFGDWYTRKGLSLQDREMITFCYLAGQGGVEPQLAAHAAANLKNGNSKEYLKQLVLVLLPYIGYPRALNALAAIEKAAA